MQANELSVDVALQRLTVPFKFHSFKNVKKRRATSFNLLKVYQKRVQVASQILRVSPVGTRRRSQPGPVPLLPAASCVVLMLEATVSIKVSNIVCRYPSNARLAICSNVGNPGFSRPPSCNLMQIRMRRCAMTRSMWSRQPALCG